MVFPKTKTAIPYRLSGMKFEFEGYKIASGEIELPVFSIKIIDNRFDTLKPGFIPIVQFIDNKKRLEEKLFLMRGVPKL